MEIKTTFTGALYEKPNGILVKRIHLCMTRDAETSEEIKKYKQQGDYIILRIEHQIIDIEEVVVASASAAAILILSTQ